MATYVRTPEGFFQSSQSGLVPITDPVQLRDLSSGSQTYTDARTSNNVPFTPNVSSPVPLASASPAAPAAPAPAPVAPAASLPVPAATGGGTDSYSKFNSSLMTLLGRAQDVGSSKGLYAQKDELNNQALNLSNPLNDTPYKPLFASQAPGVAVGNEGGTQNAFQPGITSVTSQIQAEAGALDKFNNLASIANDMGKPIAVSMGTSLVDRTGQPLYSGSKYYPVFNPLTGQYQLIDLNTGQPAPGNSSPTDQNTPAQPYSGASVVSGVDFSGKATGVGAYAEDPQYVPKINAIYGSLSSAYPKLTAANIDSYIGNNAKNSPVTGAMISSSATKYNVDPGLLTSVLNLESAFGTAGVGAKTQNPGNVGNTGSATHAFPSWQAGVDATAHELARRQVPAGAVAGAETAAPTGWPANLPFPQKSNDGTSIPTGNVVVDTAQSLVDGNTAPSQLKTGSVKSGGIPYQTYLNTANLISYSQTGQPFDAAGAESAYKFRNSGTYQKFANNAPTAIRTVQEIIDLSKDIPRSGFSFFNKPYLEGISNGTIPASADTKAKVSEMLSAWNRSADDIGLILGAGQGSDYKTKLGGIIFAPTFDQKTTTAVGADVMKAIQNKLNDYYASAGIKAPTNYVRNDMQAFGATQLTGGMQGSTPPGSTGGSGMVTMTGPKGTYQVSSDKVSIMQQNGYSIAQ